jgi:cell division protein FtsN
METEGAASTAPAPKAVGTRAASGSTKPQTALKPGDAGPAGARAAKTARTAVATATSGDVAPAVAPAESPAPVAPAARYGLEVASFIFEDRAREERDRLAVTGYNVLLRTEGQGDTATYHLVLGTFGSREEAARAADALLGAGTVQQSRIVRLRGEN